MFKNKYGYFTKDFREFVITNPLTPRPWFNYIWNENYAGLVSHTGGGFSFYISPRDNRLTRMRYNSLPWDRPGRYVILKDVDTKKYWSLSWAPTNDRKYKKYECHYGQGYTKIITEFANIYGEITYFVPIDIDAEIWMIKIVNNSNKIKKLEIYSFVELLMGNALNDLINQPNDKHFTEIFYDRKFETLVATRRYWVLNRKVSVAQPNLDWKYWLLFTQTLPISGFDSSLDSFMGKWRSEANPESVENGKMKNNEITAEDPIAALQSKIKIKPKQEINFAVIMGISPKNKNPFDNLNWDQLKNIDFIQSKFNQLKDYWNNYLDSVKVNTPDKKFNLMVNVWNPYQAAVTFNMARNAGYYHGCLLFGTGIRDQFQDILGMVLVHPEKVRARIINTLQYQFEDGSTLHNFFKLTDWGEKTNHSDTTLWIPFGITEYINETGDISILDEVIKFYDKGESTVYDHMIKAVDYCINNTSERALPKIMNGDWNDTLDKVGPEGKGETIWGAFFLAYVIQKSLEIVEFKNDLETKNRWCSFYNKLKNVINEIAWDGDWYIRAFKDNGEPIGSKQNEQGKIFLNSQSWAIISGIAPQERAEKCIESVKKYLIRDKGVQIVFPAFRKVEEDVGLISRCVPGKKENGAIFNHASSWFVLAAIISGKVDLAYDIYMKMNPINSSKNIDRYEVEPYVYAEYVTSSEHHTEGQASHSWLTGTAVWMYRIALDYILGIRPTLRGVLIDPHIPSHWKEFSVQRKFRGKIINLRVVNPNGKNSGFQKILVNSKEVNTNFIEIDKIPSNTIDVLDEL